MRYIRHGLRSGRVVTLPGLSSPCRACRHRPGRAGLESGEEATHTVAIRRLLPALAILATLATSTACSGGADQGPAAVPQRLVASVAQYRNDEGTRHLKAGVSNDGDQDIRVSQATISWPALAFPVVHLRGEAIHPGQTAAFGITFGTPRCTPEPAGDPVLVAVVDGRRRRLPLHVEDPGLLVRLHAKACAQQRLDRTATVRLEVAQRTEQVAGEEYLPADIVLRRRPGSTERVRVVDVSGSVLVTLVPRGGRGALPGELGPGSTTLRFPVLFGPAHRCDAHALGQSSQTFLTSAYLRLGERPPLRVILPLVPRERDRIMGVIHRDCA